MEPQFRPTQRARELRRSATPAEKRLWSALSNRQLHGAKFSRQMPVGPYFADFLSRTERLIVEIDDASHDLRWRADATRTAWLEARGYRVIRFTNRDVRDRLDGALHVIASALRQPHPAASAAAPPASGRGEKLAKSATARGGGGRSTLPPAAVRPPRGAPSPLPLAGGAAAQRWGWGHPSGANPRQLEKPRPLP